MNPSTKKSWPYLLSSGSLLVLILISLSWELWIAPLREGGSWLALKALPLCLPLAGILKGKIYTYQYSSMLILIYFAEAIVRLFDAQPASRFCAALATICCVVFFISCLKFVQNKRKENRHV